MAERRGEDRVAGGAVRVVAQNRRARHDYAIEETFEAGIVLQGSEVKSLRQGGASLAESYAGERGGELFLFNAHIAPYAGAKTFGHEPRRPRKLLMHRRQLDKLLGGVRRGGMTIVPLSLYFNGRGLAKVSIALARGKRTVDKRDTIKERDWQRQKARLLRQN
jgi:SsrA-binding protein